MHYSSEQISETFYLLYLKNVNIDYLKKPNVLLVRPLSLSTLHIIAGCIYRPSTDDVHCLLFQLLLLLLLLMLLLLLIVLTLLLLLLEMLLILL